MQQIKQTNWSEEFEIRIVSSADTVTGFETTDVVSHFFQEASG